jgi:TIR domain-containing protein
MTEAVTFRYDVFLSYSHCDQEWVRSELLPQIEANGLQVCIDFRDFEAGAAIVDEIQRGADESRKTLLVLTEDYLNSEWTTFERYLVQTGDPANRQRRLIPLRKGECELPKSVRYLTYVDFVNPANLKIEWTKLLKALGSAGQASLPSAPESPAAKQVDTTTRSARQGFEALLEMVRDPFVQANVATFKVVFDTSSKQIEVLGYYKDLHDLLHTLQFRGYNYLATFLRNAQNSPEDTSVWDSVLEYELTLQDLVGHPQQASREGALGTTYWSFSAALG